MENRINVAKLLKDCPSGMELDCTMIDNVVFEKLDFISSHHPIIIRRTDSNKTIHLTKYGQYSDEEDYKCVIFPKGKTTWEGFVRPCKFKVGDRIKSKVLKSNINTITKVCEDHYELDDGCFLKFDCQDKWELILNKFDINTLKSFESKVLVRDLNKDKWKSNFWGFYDIDNAMNYPYECCGNSYAQCIPYEGNEHLLGKSDDCTEYFKTWK